MGDRPWDEGTAIMGVLNTSPESFYESSIEESVADAVEQAEAMIEDGADIIDVGGESNRPDAELVSAEEEARRIVPFVEELSDADVSISVDTWKSEVARATIEAGADIINDVTAFRDPDMPEVVADNDVRVVLGHSTDVTADHPEEDRYDDVVDAIVDDLEATVQTARDAGIDEQQIIVDPGISFGKNFRHDVEIFARLEEFDRLGYPVLIGHSRKLTFEFWDSTPDGEIPDPDRLLPATVAFSAVAAERGVDVLRVHDVLENREAIRTGNAMRRLDPNL